MNSIQESESIAAKHYDEKGTCLVQGNVANEVPFMVLLYLEKQDPTALHSIFAWLIQDTRKMNGKTYPCLTLKKASVYVPRLFLKTKDYASLTNTDKKRFITTHEFSWNGDKYYINNQWQGHESDDTNNLRINIFAILLYELTEHQYFLHFTQVEDKQKKYEYRLYKTNLSIEDSNNITQQSKMKPQAIIENYIKALSAANLIFDDKLVTRFIVSLETKPFVILSGLSGSGKTQLATSFAKWICTREDQYLVVPVGADWTNREALLGYANALEPNKYEATETLKLILRASNDKKNPYFLILDEMNLSYVERYFSDFLSSMESGEPINLWEGNGSIPQKIQKLPTNLFIIGTINVDETTYMFSPKVLDRANVIEFHIQGKEMESYLLDYHPVDKTKLTNNDARYGNLMVEIASRPIEVEEDDKTEYSQTLIAFFNTLKTIHSEFGYRTASEMFRFIALFHEFQKEVDADTTIDCAIIQKMLPKLHGSRQKIVKTLSSLWQLCYSVKHGKELPKLEKIKNWEEWSHETSDTMSNIHMLYPLSAEKIWRMYEIAIENGYTSFAEA